MVVPFETIKWIASLDFPRKKPRIESPAVSVKAMAISREIAGV